MLLSLDESQSRRNFGYRTRAPRSHACKKKAVDRRSDRGEREREEKQK